MSQGSKKGTIFCPPCSIGELEGQLLVGEGRGKKEERVDGKEMVREEKNG